jgi:ATP-dependent Lhr-like helicase
VAAHGAERPAAARGTLDEVVRTLASRGALFFSELQRATGQAPDYLEANLSDLVAQGRVTCDSYGALRGLLVPVWRRIGPRASSGRWSLVERPAAPAAQATVPSELAEFVARQLLRRTGVVFRRTLTREKQPVPWRDVARACRLLEARGEVRGGRFVAGFDGEQYALAEAVTMLRAIRKRGPRPTPPVSVSAFDPLNFRGILTPDERVSPLTRQLVQVG